MNLGTFYALLMNSDRKCALFSWAYVFQSLCISFLLCLSMCEMVCVCKTRFEGVERIISVWKKARSKTGPALKFSSVNGCNSQSALQQNLKLCLMVKLYFSSLFCIMFFKLLHSSSLRLKSTDLHTSSGCSNAHPLLFIVFH